ncbi:MAG: hypothetical protein ACO1O6_05345 [Bacteroidota bacterium]
MFSLLPVLEQMRMLYQKPRSMERFHDYLRMLQDDSKGDLLLPIGGFNPMAKEHVLVKLEELQNLDAEKILEESLQEINSETGEEHALFKVAINLADDEKGGWTNRFTTDYDSKFNIRALVKRRFCTVFFWTSENYTPLLIRERTLEACYRTMYYAMHTRPKTLNDFLGQERFVAARSGKEKNLSPRDKEKLDVYLKQYGDSDDYHTIFNFFYGDEACRSLGFPDKQLQTTAGGFDFAAM